MRLLLPFVTYWCAFCALACASAVEPDIPRLNWIERSDWVNVKNAVTPRAVGDGRADDTAALQAALDGCTDGKTVYLPAGTYRITKTLALNGPRLGVVIVGRGRDTRIVWDGPHNGVMFWANGAACSRYVGLTWDGQNRAAVGFDHASKLRFETEVRHEHEAYRNFREHGIRIGRDQQLASAEILYHNCLFEKCGTGIGMMQFNDYDNTFDGCEFRDCDTAVSDDHGNFYARNCRFERSRTTDFHIHSEHGDSIRRCVSVGSRRFITEGGTIAPVTVQDCQVAGWRDPEGAVFLNGSPVLMFDCAFTGSPFGQPPVRMLADGQQLVLSGNSPTGLEKLTKPSAQAGVYSIPPGDLGGVVRGPEQRFLRSEATAPSRVFDAKRDFGAKGDGKTDDTVALQAAIDAARKAGKGALAYLPTGNYVVTRSLRVTGGSYVVGGSGYCSRILWRGLDKGTAVEVVDPQDITLEHLMVGHHDSGPVSLAADIRQSSVTGKPSRMTYDEVFVYGMYQKQPDKQGLVFDGLPAGSMVHGVHVEGNVRFRDCARAKVLFGTSYEGTVTVEGLQRESDGLLGFMVRLATITDPTLHVRDDQSITMSDFYVEQSDRDIVLEGSPGCPPGHVTVTGPKIHLNTEQPVLDIRDYAGRVFLGMDEFYCDPKRPKIISTGTSPLELSLVGNFAYNCTPEFTLSPATKLTLLANRGLGNAGGDRPEGMKTISQALDDLRRLGRLDHWVNGWM